MMPFSQLTTSISRSSHKFRIKLGHTYYCYRQANVAGRGRNKKIATCFSKNDSAYNLQCFDIASY